MSVPLTVLTGFDRDAVGDVAAGLLLTTPRLACVSTDLFTVELGYVQSRVTDGDGRSADRAHPLQDGCLTCTLRDVMVGAVRELSHDGRYDSVVVQLPPGLESDVALAWLDDLRGTAHVDTVAGLLHEGWLDDLAGDAEVDARGVPLWPRDSRSAAMVLAAALDAASVVVLPGDIGDRMDLDEHAALSVLCPDVMRLFPQTTLDVPAAALLRTGSYDELRRGLFAARGLLDPQLTLPAVSGRIELVRWQREGRPLHPQRLRDALDRLADGVIRSDGHLWVANRPDDAVHWYSAGDCLTLGPAGRWPSTRRVNHVAFLGEALSADHVHEVLDACLLTDAEFAAGPIAWARLDDPFVEWQDVIDESDVA